jgi:hypothetical protein
MQISIRFCAEDSAAVLAALEAGQTDFVATPEGSSDSSAEDWQDRQRTTAGHGFLHLCRSYLQHRAGSAPAKARRDRAHLTVRIDPISGWSRLPNGELLPPGSITLTLTLPTGTTLRPLRPTDLTLHDAGRTLREASQALRDLLGTIDGERCRFPSCTRKRKLHAHHVIQWLLGGRTDLANLVLLCSRHHTVVHAEGFRLTLHPQTRALTVTSAAGTAIPHLPKLPWRPAAELDPNTEIDAKTLPNTTYDKLNLHYAVEVLLQTAA